MFYSFELSVWIFNRQTLYAGKGRPTPPSPAGFPYDLSLIYSSLQSNGNYWDHLQHSANR